MVHRDIKPENILMDSVEQDNYSIKLTDFGFAKIASEKENTFKIPLGTASYKAPEIVRGEEYDAKVDVWSAGIVVYILLTGNAPFLGEDIEETKR